ncbi:MAG: type II toxin-antitoxin system VapC family toxin [Burkholderiaceae bacterium]
MRLLLDTHVLLWWFTDDDRLSARARALIGDQRNEVFVSAASAWEIATKYRLGKLPGLDEVISQYTDLLAADGFQSWPVTHVHALRAGGYEADHRDPFDRMLAAQSELDGLRLVTIDGAFASFGIETVW